MKVRSPLHILVIALCLLLQLQAIAGQWLHCAQLQSGMEINQRIEQEETPSISSNQLPPCHQTVASSQPTAAEKQQQENGQTHDVTPCKHCQFVCHWQCVFLMGNMVAQYIDLTPYNIPVKNPTPEQPSLSLPQKPPQVFMA